MRNYAKAARGSESTSKIVLKSYSRVQDKNTFGFFTLVVVIVIHLAVLKLYRS